MGFKENINMQKLTISEINKLGPTEYKYMTLLEVK